MAEQRSLETQAIIDRLRREGELLRNEGAHSIKSVKVDIEKFSGVLQVIGTKIDQQVDAIREMAGTDRDTRSVLQAQNELIEAEAATEEERQKLARRRFETEQLKANQDYKDQLNRDRKNDENQKGFFSRLKSFFSKETFGKIMSGVKFAGLLSIGSVLGYQFIKGFLESFGVDMEKFEKDFSKGVKDFASFIKDVNWSKLGAILSDEKFLFGAGAFALFMKGIGPIADTVLTALGLRSLLGGGGATPAPLPPVPPGDDDPDGKKGGNKKGGLKNIRNIVNFRSAVLAALGVGLISYSDQIGKLFKQDAENTTKEDLMNVNVNDTAGNSNLSVITGAASLGLMFGVKGLIAGAILGSAYILGKKLVEKIDDELNDTGDLPNLIEQALRTDGTRRRTRGGRVEFNKSVEEATAKVREDFNEEIANAQAEIERLKTVEGSEFTNAGRRMSSADQESRRARLIKAQEDLIAQRNNQLIAADEILAQRLEEGIADFDILTPGKQTQQEAEINAARRAQEARDAELVPDGPADIDTTAEAQNEKQLLLKERQKEVELLREVNRERANVLQAITDQILDEAVTSSAVVTNIVNNNQSSPTNIITKTNTLDAPTVINSTGGGVSGSAFLGSVSG